MTELRIGSRKSRLALWQTHHVADRIRAHHPDVQIEVVTMDTLGDKIRDRPLPKIGAKGLFTKELEEALAADVIDLAVHSLKDLPSELPRGLKWAGSPERAAPSDAFVSTRWSSLDEIPHDATLATGSVRRKAQLLSVKRGLRFESLRGNIDTRLRKLDEHGWDGIIMATAALERLERADLVTQELPLERFVPAVSQGAIGIETREGRDDVETILAPILHDETMQACAAERRFMSRLEGGCSVSLGAHCRRREGEWEFTGWIGSQDGRQVLTDVLLGEDPRELAEAMASDFLARGGREILGR